MYIYIYIYIHTQHTLRMRTPLQPRCRARNPTSGSRIHDGTPSGPPPPSVLTSRGWARAGSVGFGAASLGPRVDGLVPVVLRPMPRFRARRQRASNGCLGLAVSPRHPGMMTPRTTLDKLGVARVCPHARNDNDSRIRSDQTPIPGVSSCLGVDVASRRQPNERMVSSVMPMRRPRRISPFDPALLPIHKPRI